MVEFETISVDDERAKELAQILINDKALSILKLLQEESLSASEVADRLNLPLSTVVYHLDKMSRVGLIEIAGKKYGKRLREVKLYRASPKPILLMPARTSFKKRILRTIEKIQIISLSIAGFIAYGVYRVVNSLVKPVGEWGVQENITQTAEEIRKMAIEKTASPVPTTTTPTSTEVVSKGAELPVGISVILAIVAFFSIAFLLTYYLSRRNL